MPSDLSARRPVLTASGDHQAAGTRRSFVWGGAVVALWVGLGACVTGGPVGGASGSPVATVTLAGENVAFDRSSLRFPAGSIVALVFENRDPGILHNMAIYPVGGGDPVFRSETFAGIQTKTYLLGPLAEGSYRFACDLHPTMTGTITVFTP